jgi:hypothetical protein
MNISKPICGIAALTLLADVALAIPTTQTPAHINHAGQSVQASTTTAAVKHKPQLLADAQMDKVTAGDGINSLIAVQQQTQANMQDPPGVLQTVQTLMEVVKKVANGVQPH